MIADVSVTAPLGVSSSAIVAQHEMPGHLYSADLRVRGTIKGSGPSSLKLLYSLPDSFVGYRKLHSGVRIVFLKESHGKYELVNQYYPDLPATDTNVRNNASTSSQEQQVAVERELASVLGSGTSSAAEKLEVIQTGYAIPTNNYLLTELKQGIGNAQSSVVRDALQKELIIRGDTSELSVVIRNLMSDSVSPEQKDGLLYAIANWVKDRTTTPDLIKLFSSGDPALRAAAAQAMWHLADTKTAGALAKGLSDPDHQVRYYSVRGLADITRQNLWGPSIPEFEEHEQRYLQHWKDWAKLNARQPQ